MFTSLNLLSLISVHIALSMYTTIHTIRYLLKHAIATSDTFQEFWDIFRNATYLPHVEAKLKLPDCLKNAQTDLFSFSNFAALTCFFVETCQPHVRWKSLYYKHCRKHNIPQPLMASVLAINLYNLRWISASLEDFLLGNPFWFVWHFGFSNLQLLPATVTFSQ